MESINIWNLAEQPFMDELLKEINKIMDNGTTLLDMNKTKYSCGFSALTSIKQYLH
jgi:hypothetical protein